MEPTGGHELRSESALELGRVLRAIRTRLGLRLDDVAARSEGRFSATGVAGYERGERHISVPRFVELCDVYGVNPDRILADVVRATRGRPAATIDPERLAALDDDAVALIAAFLERVTASRRGGTRAGAEITIRAQDVEVLATAIDVSPRTLLERIGAGRTRM